MAACTAPHFKDEQDANAHDAHAHDEASGEEPADSISDAAPEGGADKSPQPLQADGGIRCNGDDAHTPGHDCAEVIRCLGVGPCVIGAFNCCLEFLGTHNACTSDPCRSGLTPAVCDGPEDCGVGQACCVTEGGSVCKESGTCAEPDRVCHTDADCSVGRCLVGTSDFTFREWGFCRG